MPKIRVVHASFLRDDDGTWYLSITTMVQGRSGGRELHEELVRLPRVK